jgi:CBS domain-containing protein
MKHMFVKEILQEKGHNVYTIQSSACLAEVIDELVARNCGSLVVCDGDQMVGIVTERDILRVCATRRAPLDSTPLRDVMKRNIITTTPRERVADVMGTMTEKRIRHLPVTDDGELVGIVSIGDVVKAQQHELRTENQFLKEYIQS